MSEPERPDTSTAPRRAFFPGRLSGKDREEPEPAAPEPPAGSLTQTPEPAAEPRTSLPSTQPPLPAAMPLPAPSSTPAGHALAQLTFSFGITSLQLTPFFRLGSLDLKSLSDVVSMHLVAARDAQNPLPAGVSFQIDGVELDGARIRFLRLRPLAEAREVAAPLPGLRVDGVALNPAGDAPITVTTAGDGATAVQLVGTFAVAGIDLSPAFEVESLRLEPATATALLRVVPSSRPTALDLPPAFDFAEVRLADGRLDSLRLVPSAAPAATA